MGSTLLRRTVGVGEARLPPVDDRTAARDAGRLAAVEVQLAQLRARVAAQDREIALLNATIDEMGPVNVRLGNLHGRLDELEAVVHRHPEDEDGGGDEEEAEADEEAQDDEG